MKNKMRNDYIKTNVAVIGALQEKGITNYGAVLLYSKILSMSSKAGYCAASNGYFADTILTGERNIKKYLQKLKEVNAITVFEDREDGYTKVRKIYPKIAEDGQSMNKKAQNQCDEEKEEKKPEVEKITDTKTSGNNSNSADITKNNTERFNYFKSLEYDSQLNDDELPRIVAISYNEMDHEIYDDTDARKRLLDEFTGGFYQAKNKDNLTKLIDAVVTGVIHAERKYMIMRFYTEEELQEVLQVGKRQAKALMRTSGFPSIRIGRSYRVEEGAFLDWMKQTKHVRLDYSRV